MRASLACERQHIILCVTVTASDSEISFVFVVLLQHNQMQMQIYIAAGIVAAAPTLIQKREMAQKISD